MTACLLVRAEVLDATARDAFDRWYRDEHLPQATAAFGAKRSWRAWSEIDPLVHYACYDFDDPAAVRALRGSEALARMVAEFDRVWQGRVTRHRDFIEVVQAIG